MLLSSRIVLLLACIYSRLHMSAVLYLLYNSLMMRFLSYARWLVPGAKGSSRMQAKFTPSQ